MSKKSKQKLLNGCMAAAVALSTTLTPIVVNAATPNAPSAVTRIGGFDQYATAALIAQKGWTGTSDNVVLSAGMNYNLVDALAAGPLAAKLNAPIILTDNGATLNSSAKAELLRLKPKKAYITSGTAVIKQTVLDEITAMGITPVQLGGFDQYETSVNIAKEMANQGVDITRVMLAAGWLSPADALSVAPIAAAQGIPILTTTQGQLPDSVQAYLDSIKAKVTDSYVVGGTAVVSDAVKGQLPGKVSRYFGQTKYDTNVQVLKGFAKEYKNNKVYVANGETLVDALAGVPLAAANGAPVVLVNQQLDNATKDFVKLNMSTTDMVALGGEVVVPSEGMNALTSAVAYATDSTTLGSTDATQLVELTDNVQITGKNVTLKNAKANYSVYVKGDNITLSNLTVKGTVFVDPGDTGTATLDGVTATNIVILSGAADSIHIKNTTSSVLTVDSSSNVHVDVTGTTTIGNTVVRTFAIMDSNGGSMGVVTVSSTLGQSPVVELRGTFTQPVVVSGDVTLKAAAGAVVPNVVVSSNNSKQKVILDGTFKAVEVTGTSNLVAAPNAVIGSVAVNTANSEQKVTLTGKFKDVQQTQGKVALGANTTVDSMKATTKTEITIPVGSSIGSLDAGSTGTLVGGGGKANGQDTPATPTGTTPPATGGGGGGGGSSYTATLAQVVTKIMTFRGYLTDTEIASLSDARSKLVTAVQQDALNDAAEGLITTQVAAKFKAKGVERPDAKAAIINSLEDFQNIHYSDNKDTLTAALSKFKADNGATFRTLFGDDFEIEELFGYLMATQDELQSQVKSEILKNPTNPFGLVDSSSSAIKDKLVELTKTALHKVAEKSVYKIFEGKLAAIGWNTDLLVETQREVGAIIDPLNAAEKAVALSGIRSQIGTNITDEILTLNIKSEKQVVLSIKGVNTGEISIAGYLDWTSSDKSFATVDLGGLIKASADTTKEPVYIIGSKNGNELVRITVNVN